MAANIEQANSLLKEYRTTIEDLQKENLKLNQTIEVLYSQIDHDKNKCYDC